MNIQIFGTAKCFDTKKAQRYFKERKIKFQFINLKEKPMSKGEFQSVKQAVEKMSPEERNAVKAKITEMDAAEVTAETAAADSGKTEDAQK